MVRTRELAVIIVAIFIGTTSSAHTGGSDHYHDAGMELSGENRYAEAIEMFRISDWLINNGWADAPVVTYPIRVKSSREEKIDNSTLYIQEKSKPATLQFSLTNYNDPEIIVSPIYIDVLNYSPKRLSNEYSNPLSTVPSREYICTILNKTGLYECRMKDGSNMLLNIAKNSTESLNISLRAKEEGVYVIRVGFIYDIGEREKRYSDRQNITMEFYDSSKRRDE